jgi:glycosyltransferase involved in cell wall biosynthesis
MQAPLVSVITPFYNVEGYLREAIESVLHQDYTNWELLLVDDGSSDGSTAIAREYAASFPEKIRCLAHPGGVNKGVPASRNLALGGCQGAYIALLDADDYWFRGKLAHQVAIAEQYPEAALICGASLYWNSWADGDKKDVAVPVGGPQDELIRPPLAALELYPLGKGAAPCPCSILVKRDTALRHHGFEEDFRGKYQFYEDQAFLVKIYLNEPIYICSRAMDRYRQRPGSLMAQSEREKNYAEVRHFFLKWLRAFLKREGIRDQAVEKKVNEAFLPYRYPLLHKIKSSLKRR